MLSVPDLQLLVMIWWSIGWATNHGLFNYVLLEPPQILARADNVLISLRVLGMQFCPKASPNDIAGVVNWKLPLEGWFKLNVQLAVDATRGLFGLNVVVCNYEGEVMVSEFVNVGMWMMLILVWPRPSTLAYDSLVRLIYLRSW